MVSFMCILVWGIYCGIALYFVIFFYTKHIIWYMVPSSLDDPAKSTLPSTPLPSNPSWSIEVIRIVTYITLVNSYILHFFQSFG